MCGWAGKCGATDRTSAIAHQRDTSPITITEAERATTVFVRDQPAARFPVWPEPGTSTDGPRGYLRTGLGCCGTASRTPDLRGLFCHDAPAAPHLAFAIQ